MADPASPFAVQKDVRVPWRKYLDELIKEGDSERFMPTDGGSNPNK